MLDGLNVLVTGGTGSFGAKFIETVLAHGKPERLVVLSRDELKQHEMRQRFPEGDGSPMRYMLGDVRDKDRLYRAFADIDIVIHAAALKQVPACEYNPFEAIKTNVLGAANIVDAAIDRGVGRVLALSTDKACNPVNLYGATKLCAEKVFVAGKSYSGSSGPRFSVVRYGNVAMSRGSVIPLWLLHARSCGATLPTRSVITPFTHTTTLYPTCDGIKITDERMTRFWLTLDQAVAFVLARLDHMQGGEVFVPKLPSVRIVDLAHAIAPDCRTEIVGIRPGEKLHEAMIGPDENYDEHEWGFTLGPDKPMRGAYASDTNAHWLDLSHIRELAEAA